MRGDSTKINDIDFLDSTLIKWVSKNERRKKRGKIQLMRRKLLPMRERERERELRTKRGEKESFHAKSSKKKFFETKE